MAQDEGVHFLGNRTPSGFKEAIPDKVHSARGHPASLGAKIMHSAVKIAASIVPAKGNRETYFKRMMECKQSNGTMDEFENDQYICAANFKIERQDSAWQSRAKYGRALDSAIPRILNPAMLHPVQ